MTAAERGEALSWLKIFQMASNTQTAEKSHGLKKNGGRAGLGLTYQSTQSPAASGPSLGVPPPQTQGALKVSWMKGILHHPFPVQCEKLHGGN